jgi:hypothetical protein
MIDCPISREENFCYHKAFEDWRVSWFFGDGAVMSKHCPNGWQINLHGVVYKGYEVIGRVNRGHEQLFADSVKGLTESMLSAPTEDD